MNAKKTTFDAFESSSDVRRRLLRQEELILDVTERILEVLEKDGLTQAELAQRLGKSRSHVCQILSGSRNVTLRTLADVGDALGRRVKLQLQKSSKTAQMRNVVQLSDWKQRRIDRTSKASSQDLPAVQGMRP